MMRHDVLVRCVRAGVSGVGFKILLDLFATSPTPLRFREVPYTFRNRYSGESKLDTNVAWEYFIMLLDRLFGRAVPIRFIAFSLVGGLGLLVHLAVLAVLFKGGAMSFFTAQTAATLVAMTSNFALNNLLTYRDMRLRGWRLLRGWFRSSSPAASAPSPMSASPPICSSTRPTGWPRLSSACWWVRSGTTP